jgi:hypothetical protein
MQTILWIVFVKLLYSTVWDFYWRSDVATVHRRTKMALMSATTGVALVSIHL